MQTQQLKSNDWLLGLHHWPHRICHELANSKVCIVTLNDLSYIDMGIRRCGASLPHVPNHPNEKQHITTELYLCLANIS